MDDPRADLLDAVDKLTLESREHHAQLFKLKDGPKWRVHTVRVPSLLDQLRAAVHPSGEQSGTHGSAPDTRSVLDVEALHLLAVIGTQAHDWCRMAGIRRRRQDIAGNLRAWHAHTLALVGFDPGWAVGQLRKWARQITEHLEPPKSFEAHYPCPICGTTEWGDRIGGGSQWPIEIRYRIDDDGAMRGETALCRACRVVWDSHAAVVELADEMHEKAAV